MKTSCNHCGKELDRPPSRLKANPTQFCDHACHAAFRSRQMDRTCVVCGNPFTKKASRVAQGAAVTCSPECRSKRLSDARIEHFGTADSRVVTCNQCGKAFARKPSQIAKYPTNFCSRECKRVHQSHPMPERVVGHWVPCETCGSDVWRTPATEREHVFCSRKCAGRAGEPRPNHPGPGFVGPTHPRWTGGYRPYTPGFTRGVSKRVRERDGNACRICGLPWEPKSGNLVCHHIDELKLNHDDANLITLCRPCHLYVHAGKTKLPD